MSGGVDSTIAAARLIDAGHEVATVYAQSSARAVQPGAPPPPPKAQRQTAQRQTAQRQTAQRQPPQRLFVRFDEPVRALCPGQAAVAYDGQRVLGGGTIHRALQADELP